MREAVLIDPGAVMGPEMIDPRRLPKPYYEHAGITIYHGDCREILPQLPKVDAVITDPPYGIKADRCRGSQRFGWTDYGPSDWDSAPVDADLLAGMP